MKVEITCTFCNGLGMVDGGPGGTKTTCLGCQGNGKVTVEVPDPNK